MTSRDDKDIAAAVRVHAGACMTAQVLEFESGAVKIVKDAHEEIFVAIDSLIAARTVTKPTDLMYAATYGACFAAQVATWDVENPLHIPSVEKYGEFHRMAKKIADEAHKHLLTEKTP